MAHYSGTNNSLKQNSNNLKIILVILILTNVLLGYKVIKAKYFRYDPDYTYNRKDLFERLQGNVDSTSIVFVGNSLTQQFELAELFKNNNIRNRGINGDYTSGVLSRLAVIIQPHPKKIFLENGINDLKDGLGIEKLMENYTKILTTLQQETSTSKLYVQSIMPFYKKGGAVANSSLKNEDIRNANKLIEDYCNKHGITFINLYNHFVLNGEMNPRYCIADGLHISGEGYLLWTSILKMYVNE